MPGVLPFINGESFQCNQTGSKQNHRHPQECFQRESTYFGGGKFEIDGTGTNEGAENKNGTVKSVNILIYLKFLRSF